MDWYFILCIVAFFAIGIVMVFFAYQGPTCIDFDESHYEQISREDQHSQQNLNLSMPLPQTNNGYENAPAVSLTSPYPQKPPPLGFGRILAERTEVLNSYPQDEEGCRMAFPAPMTSFSYVDSSSNFIKKKYPPQPHLNETTEVPNPYPQEENSCRTSFPAPMSSFSYVDPPSNFIKKKYPQQPHVNEMPPLTRSTHCPSVSTQTGGATYTRNEPPPPYTEAAGQSQQLIRTRRNRFKKRLSQ